MQISSIPAIGLSRINTMMQTPNRVQTQMACQPLKKAQDYEFAMPFKAIAHNEDGDSAELSTGNTMEEKYDFACRLAAFYKNQYENLKTKGSCEA